MTAIFMLYIFLQVLRTEKGLQIISEQIHEDHTASIYAAIFGVIKSTMIVSLTSAHDSFHWKHQTALRKATESSSSSTTTSTTTTSDSDTPRRAVPQLQPSDIDPLEQNFRTVQANFARQAARIDQLERENSELRRKLSASTLEIETRIANATTSPSATQHSPLPVVSDDRSLRAQQIEELQHMNDALRQKNDMLLSLLRKGNTTPSSAQPSNSASSSPRGVNDNGRLIRPRINISLIQRQFEVLYEQRAQEAQDNPQRGMSAKARRRMKAHQRAMGAGSVAQLTEVCRLMAMVWFCHLPLQLIFIFGGLTYRYNCTLFCFPGVISWLRLHT